MCVCQLIEGGGWGVRCRVGSTGQRDYRGVATADWWNWGRWGLKEYKWKGSFLGWFVKLVVPVQEILAVLVGPVQIFFTSLYTFSLHLSPSPSKLGRQSCRVPCLLICVSGNDHSISQQEILRIKHFEGVDIRGSIKIYFYKQGIPLLNQG